MLGEWWARSLLTLDAGEHRREDAVNTERNRDMGTGTGCGGRKRVFLQRERSQHISVLTGELHEQGETDDVEREELEEISPSRSGQASRGGIPCTSSRRATHSWGRSPAQGILGHPGGPLYSGHS